MALFRRKSDNIISPTQPSQAVSLNGQPRSAQSGPALPAQTTPPATASRSVETPPLASDPGRSTALSLTVEDVFSITGRGTVVVGQVAHGHIRVGDIVRITPDLGATSAQVTALEMFRKKLPEAGPGDKVGVFLAGVHSAHVRRGSILSS